MLSRQASPVIVRSAADGRRATIAAVAPTARVAHLGAAGATLAFAAVPALVTATRGVQAVSTPLIIACLAAGAALGWAVDDPAADLLGSMPVSSSKRAGLRVLLVAGLTLVAMAVTGLVVALGPGLPADRGDRLSESAAAAALALAVGLVAARRGEHAAGAAAVTAGVLGTGLVAALAFRWPTVLPAFAPGPTHWRWWVLAAVGVAVAARAGRDPGRR